MPGFSPAQFAKTDIDRIAEAHQRELQASLKLLTEKLYRRNPKEWKKGGWARPEDPVERLFGKQHNWHFAELDGKFGTDAVQLSLRPDYGGDRVFAFIAGLGGMLLAAFNDCYEFYMTDDLDPQKLYNAARNVEIAVWKLSHDRAADEGLLLLSNDSELDPQPQFRARVRQDHRQSRPVVEYHCRQEQPHCGTSGAKHGNGRVPARAGYQVTMKKYVILISGRGSNMQALLAADLPGECAAVISNRPDAAGLVFAQQRGVATAVVDHRRHADRAAFDAALAAEIERHAPDLVLLAGFMRVLGDDFVRRFAGRMLNIHPSLLPAFPGLHTHRAALAAGVRIHGCTVHFVTPALDNGPIVIQAAVPVLDGDDETALAERVLTQEHIIYPQAAAWFLQGRLRLIDGRVASDVPQPAGAALLSPSLTALP